MFVWLPTLFARLTELLIKQPHIASNSTELTFFPFLILVRVFEVVLKISYCSWGLEQTLSPGPRPTLVPGSLSNSEFSRQTSNHELLDMTSNLWCNLWCSSQATCYLATRLLEHKAPGGQDKTKPAFKRFRNIAAIISSTWSSKQRTQQIMEKSH